jgi:hypothetical protein
VLAKLAPRLHAYAASNGLPNFFLFGEVDSDPDSLLASTNGATVAGNLVISGGSFPGR